jgi:hypothetical protein
VLLNRFLHARIDRPQQATCLAAGTDSRLCDLNVADCENGNGLNKATAAMNDDAADPNADPTPAGCQATSFGTFCDNIGAINVGSLKTPVSGDEATGSLFTVGNLVFPEREVALQVGCLTDVRTRAYIGWETELTDVCRRRRARRARRRATRRASSASRTTASRV